jgi:integrase
LREYDRLTSEWLARGRQRETSSETDPPTVNEVMVPYLRHVKIHYTKEGQQTTEVTLIQHALRSLKARYGHTLAQDFGPLALKALRQSFVDEGICRAQCNARTQRIRRMFRWLVSEQLVPAGVLHALQSVDGLRAGRTAARDLPPVPPATEAQLTAIMPHLSPVVADMVRFQRLTGCRPGEVCALRPCEVDTSGEVWQYRPRSHKTQHHGQARIVFIGPQAQDVLRPYLLRAKDQPCFSPADSERLRHADQRAKRKTKVQPSQQNRRVKKPKRPASGQYDRNAYTRALARASEAAFPTPKGLTGIPLETWRRENHVAPNQLRHSAATTIRQQFGLEAAQTVLGHSRCDTTQVYAERDFSKAAEIMKMIG